MLAGYSKRTFLVFTFYKISGFPHKQMKRFTSCLVRKMIEHQTKKIYLKKFIINQNGSLNPRGDFLN